MTRMHRLAKPYHGSGRACPCHVSPTYSPTSRIRQQSPTRIGFLVRPLRGRMERGNQGTPLKPRQGPCPWTPLLKNLYLKASMREAGSSVVLLPSSFGLSTHPLGTHHSLREFCGLLDSHVHRSNFLVKVRRD